ncbi:MAG: DUF2911 domain-containing protein, partial [Gemmatimonadetes bacterium]|nr:DUF2911 domain-containing protein [Gemmatimonadota bacterium]
MQVESNVTMRRAAPSTFLAMAIALLACEPAADRGAFVVRLGSDTVAIEEYVKTGNRFEATSVARSPRTVVRRYVAELAQDGSVARHASNIEGATLDEQAPAVSGAIPLSGQFWVSWEIALRRAVASGQDTVTITMLSDDEALPTLFQRAAPDRWTWSNQFAIPITARVDGSGRIVSIDAGGGSTVERVTELDVAVMGAEFARRDSAGQGLGPLSPRDTARAMVAGASLMIDYGRPSLRGRDLGMLVPPNQVWRTGANDATHFQTDRGLMIGDATVPAGTYTFYTHPSPEGWTLIINQQTG